MTPGVFFHILFVVISDSTVNLLDFTDITWTLIEWRVNMLDLLRKLGILRYGTKKAKFTSAKDMPTEFLMNDVSNAEKDLVNKQDVEKVRKALKTSKGKAVLKWLVICIVGFLGICFALGMLFGTDEPGTKDQVTSTAKDAVSTPATFDLTGPNVAPPRPVTVADEINLVFSAISQANIDENIAAFMQYYAAAFPDRAGKEQKTLETWRKYDFASLDFFVFALQVDGNRAEASVGWEMALLENGGGQPRLAETTNEVVLEKGDSGWQIVSLQ